MTGCRGCEQSTLGLCWRHAHEGPAPRIARLRRVLSARAADLARIAELEATLQKASASLRRLSRSAAGHEVHEPCSEAMAGVADVIDLVLAQPSGQAVAPTAEVDR